MEIRESWRSRMSWHNTAPEALTETITSAITQDSREIVGYHSGIEYSWHAMLFPAISNTRSLETTRNTTFICCFPTDLHVTGHTHRCPGLAQSRTVNADYLRDRRYHRKQAWHFLATAPLEQILPRAFTRDTKCWRLTCKQCFFFEDSQWSSEPVCDVRDRRVLPRRLCVYNCGTSGPFVSSPTQHERHIPNDVNPMTDTFSLSPTSLRISW